MASKLPNIEIDTTLMLREANVDDILSLRDVVNTAYIEAYGWYKILYKLSVYFLLKNI